MGKKSESGSGMNNPDHVSEREFRNNFKFFAADPGWKKFGSRIRIKHPGPQHSSCGSGSNIVRINRRKKSKRAVMTWKASIDGQSVPQTRQSALSAFCLKYLERWADFWIRRNISTGRSRRKST
jgi:hypothetical protein